MTTTPPPTDDAGEGDRLQSHLAAAGELLAARQFRQAEVEILRALSTTPSDRRALNLLALVRFKLGKLEDARATYSEIAALQPSDAGIQRNFGLVSLKMEKYDEAVTALERATRLAPDDLRAWSYLGYALAKRGDSAGAALAFRRGGQDLLAAQLEPAVVPVADVSTSKVLADGAVTAKAKGEAAAPLASRLDDRAGPTKAAPTEIGDVRALRGSMALPVPPRPVSLVSFALASLGADSFVLPAAAFAFPIEDDATVRHRAALAWEGPRSWQRAYRRVRGCATNVPLGTERDAFFRVSGAGSLWLAGAPGRWTVVALDDDIVYLREAAVLAFDHGLSWEAGRIPGDGLRLIQFRGTGRVALQFHQPPTAIRMSGQRPLFVPRSRLLGWVGRIVPQGQRAADRPFQIRCDGEGVVLLDVGRSPRHHRRPNADTSGTIA